MTTVDDLRRRLAALERAAGGDHPPAPASLRALRGELQAHLAGLAAGLGPAPAPADAAAFSQALALGLALEDLVLRLARGGRPDYLDLPGLTA